MSKKLHIKFLFVVTIVFLGISRQSFGQLESVKRNAVEDCSRAIEQIDELNSTERPELVEHLKTLLKLETSPPFNLALPDLTKMSGLGAPPLPDGWRMVEPEKEVEAKRCGILLLRLLGSDAIAALPELLTVTQAPTVSQRLRDLAEISILSIVHKARRLEPSKFGDPLLREILKSGGVLLPPVLVELKAQFSEFLIRELLKQSELGAQEIWQAVFEIDPFGETLGPRLWEMVAEKKLPETEIGLMVMARMPGLATNVTTKIIRDLSHSNELIKEHLALDLLKAIPFSPKSELAISVSDGEKLISYLSSSQGDLSDSDLDIFETVMTRILQYNSSLASQVASLRNSGKLGVQLMAINALSKVAHKNTIALAEVSEAAISDDFTKALVAIGALGNIANNPAAVIKTSTLVLKKYENHSDLHVRESVLRAVAATLLRSNSAKKAYRLSSYFIPGLERDLNGEQKVLEKISQDSISRDLIVQVFIQFGNSTLAQLIKRLPDLEPNARAKIAFILGSIEKPNPSNLRALEELIRDSNSTVKEIAAHALIKLGKEAMPILSRLALDKDRRLSLFATSLLVVNLAEPLRRDKEVVFSDILESLAPADPFLPQYLSLLKEYSLNPEQLERLRDKLVESGADEEIQLEIAQLLIRDPDSFAQLVEFMKNRISTAKEFQKVDVDLIRELNLRAPKLVVVLKDLLALQMDRFKRGSLSYCRVAEASSIIDSDQSNFSEFVFSEIQEERLPQFVNFVSTDRSSELAKLLADVLKTAPEGWINSMLLVLKALGGEGSGIQEILNPYLVDLNLRNRFTALTAALSIVRPADKKVVRALVWALGSRFYGDLLQLPLSKEDQTIVRDIVKSSDSEFVKRNARLWLEGRNINNPTVFP